MDRPNAVALALALGATLPMPGCGSSTGQIEPRYVAVHNALTALGMSHGGSVHEGALDEGGDARAVIELQGGVCYAFVALGSGGVRDLDVMVLDEAGQELGRDTTLDRQAAVHVCPEVSSEYQLVVRMMSGHGSYRLSSWSGEASGSAGGAVIAGGGTATCGRPLELAVGRPVRGDTRAGDSAMRGGCVRGGAPEQVYRVEVPQRSQVSATLQSEFDGALYLLGTCGDLQSELACNDDASRGETNRSQLDVAALEPGTYYLVVDGYGSEGGEYELILSMSELRAIGAVCGEAEPLQPGQPTSGATDGSPDYFHATCAGGANAPDRVYRLDVPSRSRLRVRTETDYDGALYLRSSCEDPNSELACNDDYGDQRHSVVSNVVEAGRYFVYVDGYGAQGQTTKGTFTVRADLVPDVGTGAGADGCGNAGSVTSGRPLSLDTFPARDDMQGSCGGQGAADVVYRIDVQNRSRIRVGADASEFDGLVYLQRRCGEPDAEVACAELPSSATSGSQPNNKPDQILIDEQVQPGAYYLVVDGRSDETFGAAVVSVQLEDLVAIERSCRTAPMLRTGTSVSGSTLGGASDFRASCAGGANSPDEVYRLQVRHRSSVTVTMTSDYDGALHLRGDCVDQSSELACNDDQDDNRSSRVQATLEPGLYYVVVDGFRTGNAGNFELQVEMERR